MIDQTTLGKLQELRLYGMIRALSDCSHNDALQQLSFQEGIKLLIDQEHSLRQTKRLERFIKQARLRYPAAMVEDINYEHKRAINPEQFRWMASGAWLANHQNIILLGPTGLGKTFLASACGQLACRKGAPTRYFRMAKLLESLRIAHADGSYHKLLSSLLKAQCLILDDWGIDPISPERRADLLEIIDDHYEQRSLIIAAQLPIEHWHDYIGDHTIADALLDRVVHKAKIFTLNGDSMRAKLDSI
jgi:DNA replication protein DnaC